MSCTQCGTELLPGRKFCHACGAPAPAACPSCGARIEADWRFCPDCGRALQAGAAVPAPPPARPSPSPLPAPPDERFARLARHIPESLAKRIRAAGAVAGERKRATVFFCDLVGSTAIAERLDPETYRELLDEYLAVVCDRIYRFEGIVNQLAGDGLMALFGAPIAHEDAPERAVRAALEIQEALAELGARLEAERGFALHARIGIHTGIVVAGTVGNDFKMDYTAVGDTTNLASRLQTLAEPGTILISEACHALLRGGFRTRARGPFEVRGKSEAVHAHEVLGLAAPASAFAGELTPFVGRDAELAQLVGCFDRLDTGLAQIVSIVGDAGIGKSRLVHEFKKRIQGRELELLEARCSSLTRSIPYAPWTAMMRRFFGVESADDQSCACGKVSERLRAEGLSAEESYADLCHMLALTPATKDEPVEGVARHRGFDAVARLIEQTSLRVPVVMMIEDLHWLDDASREVLEMAVARTDTARVMIVTTHRPDHRPNWQSNAAFTQLRLRPLGDADAARIVRARAGGALPREVEERLVRKGDGNPFYLEELTRALVEDGTFVARDGEVVVTRRPDEIRIPDTIGEVVGARIDRLRPGAKRVAQVASVVGRQFRRRHVEALLGGEPIDVGSELAELERRGVLHRNGEMANDEYRFGESLTQEVAYEGLLLRERRALHDRIAGVLEAEAGDPTQTGDARARHALAAHHLARGDDRMRGIDALLSAADEAQRLPSYGDAMRLFREAWRLAETALADTREPSTALKRLALRAAVGVSTSSAVYGDDGSETDEKIALRGLDLAAEVGDAQLHSNLLASFGLVTLNGPPERFAEGLRMIEEAVAIARRAGPAVSVFRAARGLVLAYTLDGRFAEARRLGEEVLAALGGASEGARTSDAYLGARFFKSRLLLDCEAFDECEAWLQETLEIARRASNRTVQSASLSMLASVAFTRGDYDAAERFAEAALPIAEAIESLAAQRSSTATLLLVRAERGGGPVSSAELERLERGLLSSGDLGAGTDVIVEALLAHGDVARARRIAEARLARAGGRLRQARSAYARGLVALRVGAEELPVAERCFGEALALGKELGLRAIEGKAHLGLAEVARARALAEPMVSHARQALALLRPLRLGHYESRAARLLLEQLEGSAPNA